MSRGVLVLMVFAAVSVVPLSAADGAFTFNTGGGISTPLNPTGQYAGTSGNFVVGDGYRISRRSAIVGQFMWSGLPPNLFVHHPVSAPFGKINLFTLTANYRYGFDRSHGSRFGLYAIGGGGWTTAMPQWTRITSYRPILSACRFTACHVRNSAELMALHGQERAPVMFPPGSAALMRDSLHSYGWWKRGEDNISALRPMIRNAFQSAPRTTNA